MKKMNVVWLVYWPNTIYLDIAHELGKLTNLKLIFCDVYKNKNFKKNNFEAIFLKFNSNYFNKLQKINEKYNLPPLVYFKNFYDELDDLKPDLVISNLFYMPASHQAAKYCAKRKIPFILQTEIKRLPENFLLKFLTKLMLIYSRKIFNQARLILPWTNQAVSFGKKNFGQANIRKIKLLAPGINTRIFKPDKKYEDNKYKILYIGRLVPYKNHLLLLNACKILESDRINFHLTLIGDGPMRQIIDEQIKKMNLDKRVTLINHIKYEELRKVYSKHDVFVLPSLNEAIGMVIPEAMACGLPTIVSDCAGATTYIKNNESGLLFKSKNLKDLVKKLIIISNKNVQKKIGSEAKKEINKKFSIKKVTKTLYKYILYQ